ncbi:MAG: hypothetical protein LBH45_06880 [Campylobacteraceae bacterium]|jgi:hypothetical protein|nr:hypothetical protein [Campylobacteraceae bacterium]
MINIKYIVAVFLALNLLVVLLSLYMGFDWFINTQIGFAGSFVITVFSLFSYKKMVENRVSLTDENFIERDTIDKIEDLHDLYEESEQRTSKLKENAKHLKTSVRGFFSIYRVIGYALFFISFLTLVKSGHFAFLPFMIGVSVTPLGTLICGIFSYMCDKNRID